MNLYTKRYIDNMLYGSVADKIVVELTPLTDEDISKYIKNFNRDNFRSNTQKNNVVVPTQNNKLKEKKDDLEIAISTEATNDIPKLQLESTQNTSLPFINASTNNCNSLIGKIKICDPRTMMDEVKYQKFISIFCDKNIEILINDSNMKNDSPNSNLLVKKLSLDEINDIFVKYFSKNVKDTVLVISTMLKLISISKIHHREQIKKLLQNKNETQNSNEKINLETIYLKQKKILEKKLKMYFEQVVSTFDDSVFEHIFQILFSSILTTFRLIEPLNIKVRCIYENIKCLLLNSLKSNNYVHPKVFKLLENNIFCFHCINSIEVIENTENLESNNNLIFKFFLIPSNNLQYFQPVIKAIKTNSDEYFEILIDIAVKKSFINSKFKDPENNLLISSSIRNTDKNFNDDTMNIRMARNINGNYQSVPSESRPRKIAKMTINSSEVKSSFVNKPSSLLTTTVPVKRTTPRYIAPKSSVVSPISISNGTTVKLKALQAKIQNDNSIETMKRTGKNLYLIRNKTFKVVLKGEALKSNNTRVSNKPRETHVKMCSMRNCKTVAIIMCSHCKNINYCSSKCQRLDWFESHSQDCQDIIDLTID